MEAPCDKCKEEFCNPDTCIALDNFKIQLRFMENSERAEKEKGTKNNIAGWSSGSLLGS